MVAYFARACLDTPRGGGVRHYSHALTTAQGIVYRKGVTQSDDISGESTTKDRTQELKQPCLDPRA